MYKNITVEAENLELILENSHGDKVIIPANKRSWVKQKLSEGCHNCIDNLVETLPIASQYAQDGSIYPVGTKVKVNENNQIKEYDISSQEYRDLYNSGKLANVVKDKVTGEDTYVMPSLKEVEIVGKATSAARDMIDTKKSYSKEQYIKEKLPAFAGSLGVTADNLGGNAEGYKRTINTKVAENILKRKPNAKEKDLTPYELEVINNSDLAYKIRANLGERFEQGILSVGNAGSPVEFKSPNLTPDQAKRENTPLNIFAPLEAGTRAVRKAIGDTDEPNFLKDIALDPLNLFGLGLIDDLPKLGKAAKALNKERQIAGSIEGVAAEVNAIPTPITAPLRGNPANNTWEITSDLVESGFASNQDVPKLTLKSVTPGSSLEGRVNKAGEINISDILAHTNKQATSKADKTILEEVLNEHYQGQTKLNYKEFTDKVNKKLIPLEERKVELYKSYGLNNIYPDEHTAKIKKLYDEHSNLMSGFDFETVRGRVIEIRKELEESENLKAQNYVENTTILYENEKAFGKGNADHFNENTLGHSRHVITKEEPDVMHVLESQSDYYQKNVIPSLDDVERVKDGSLEAELNLTALKERELHREYFGVMSDVNYLKDPKIFEKAKALARKLYTEQDKYKRLKSILDQVSANKEGFNQKVLLKDSHPKRFLQEQFNYAGKKGLKKLRYPTPETAIKIQNYPKETPVVDAAGNTVMDYSPKHKTIIKKYTEFPKLAKKTTGKDIRIVTDSYGNTWYELDIPEAFKEGKGTIEALSVIPPAVVGTLTLKEQLNKNKSK